MRSSVLIPGSFQAVCIACGASLALACQSCGGSSSKPETASQATPQAQQAASPNDAAPRTSQAPQPAEPGLPRLARGELLRQSRSQQSSAPAPGAEPPASNRVTTETGLQYEDLVVGQGPQPRYGQTVTVNYTGWLTDGTKFDSSLDKGQPFQFVLGAREVIQGWDQGVSTMRVGGRRRLIVPPALAYGDRGAGGVIPPGATLVFEVELLGAQ